MKSQSDRRDFQVGYFAVNKKGEVGTYSIRKGFSYTIYQNGENKRVDPGFYLEGK
ncbi:hypothetical protein [Moheibacter lacus]|uniref:Uncharacterized protein n=1 Tax=Moheibacter lacus TaxID=2745851 RepID=A0A838ZFQ5_9FLAO|nr:hypothetical protein [Moheibacter lacus]MBA5628561.1 hypothetical protein [Moheibacter lacus]